MQKALLISSLLVTTLLSDNSLGEKISVSSAQETISSTPNTALRTRVNPNRQTAVNRPNNAPQLTTRVAPSNVKRTFRKDHHRYDKRYSNFDYDRNGYYNDDGYYYGYYDTTGYFYNNIYFTYDNSYTYNDRYYRRGHFAYGYTPRRHYIYHRMNDWNRIHCYREPNVIVTGRYYDRAYYPRTRHYNNYNRSNYYGAPYNARPYYNNAARMHVNRRDNNQARRSANYNTQSNTRSYSNNYRSNNNYRNNSQNQIRRGQARMNTRGSFGKHSRHMGLSK